MTNQCRLVLINKLLESRPAAHSLRYFGSWHAECGGFFLHTLYMLALSTFKSFGWSRELQLSTALSWDDPRRDSQGVPLAPKEPYASTSGSVSQGAWGVARGCSSGPHSLPYLRYRQQSPQYIFTCRRLEHPHVPKSAVCVVNIQIF